MPQRMGNNLEEIHRNNIIVYAIVQHAVLTGNMDYIAQYGLEVMIAVSRFWSQRVSFSQPKQKYVILGVTGPDEYENNVDNNWYTNYSCIQCLKMTLRFLEMIAQQYPDEYARIRRITNLDQVKESARWRDIIEHMYLPEDKERGIFIQNDGYMDKVLESTDNIPAEERPINQHWSWDRILRSCYIKQSDVLLGLYLYYFYFDTETVRRNFEFYEPMTVHESSPSPRTSTPFLPHASGKWKRHTNYSYTLPASTWTTTTMKESRDCTSPVCRAVGWLSYAGSQDCRYRTARLRLSRSCRRNGAAIRSK